MQTQTITLTGGDGAHRREPAPVEGATDHVAAPLSARLAVFAYGVLCYLVFLGTFVYAAGWLTNLFVPRSIDSLPRMHFGVALVIDLALLGLFAVQHSVMARPAFKRWWTRFVPEPMERPTYCLFSSLALIAIFALWQPMGGIVWSADLPALRGVLFGVGVSGWAIVLLSTFLINHFDLFGLRQPWLYLLGKPYTRIRFKTPLFYKWVRHPLYVGWILAFWGTPTMTVAHLVFAVSTTVYILLAIQFEERDLIRELGVDYVSYRKRVPMIVPFLSKKCE